MADRVVLLNRGRIEQNATPVELYENPANTFVARFIGTPPMNLLPLDAGRGGAVIAGTDGPAVAPADCAGLTLGVRPEHIALGFERGARADVAAVEYLGADSLVTCRLGAATARRARAGQRRPRARRRRVAHVGAGRAAPVRARRRRAAPTSAQRRHRRRSSLDVNRVASQRRTSMSSQSRHSRAHRRRRCAWPRRSRSRKRRSRCRSTTRSPSAARSRRSSTASPPTSRRKIPGSS